MTNPIFYFIFISFIIGLSCQNYDKSIQIDSNGVQLTLPGFVKQEELADDAFIEYANRYRNFYIVGLEQNSDKSIDSVWYENIKRLTKQLKKPTIDTTVNQNIITTEIKGNFKDEKEPIFYFQKLIYGKEKSYLLTIWTRGDQRYKKFQPIIKEILTSFKVK